MDEEQVICWFHYCPPGGGPIARGPYLWGSHLGPRVTETSITLIDHIYVSNESNVSEKIVSKINISDHYPTGLTWKLGRLGDSNHNDNHHIIRYRNLPDYNVICDLIYDNMEAVTNIQDLDSKVLKFNNVLNLALDSVAPLKTKRVKRNCQPPWFNNKILKVIKIREAAKQKGCTREYKFWRNKVSSLISSEKQNYYKSLLKDSEEVVHRYGKLLMK